MLDSIRERTHGWMAKVILALITIPFALFGIESYFSNKSADDTVAKVDGHKISRLTFDRAIKDQRAELAASMGPGFDPAMLDDPKVKQSILDNLIKQQLLITHARSLGMVVSDAQLAKFIGAVPAFQENGQFSVSRYEQVLRQQGMTVADFERRVRDELLMNDMRATFAQSPSMSTRVVKQFANAFEQQREVSMTKLATADLLKQVQITPAQIKAYYDAHQLDFNLPAQAKFQYVVLSLDDIAKNIKIDDASVAQYYQANSTKYSEPEQRSARHILIAVTANADAAKRAAAKAQADALFKQVSADPAKFAELAKQYSADPGSAASGGDLGWFPRSAMVKPFADAAFTMRPNEIKGPIATDFGYHIIQLTGIKPAQVQPLEAVKPAIVSELQKQQASKQFADAAERFSNQVYEQSSELQATAKSLGLTVVNSDWIARTGGANAGILSAPKMLTALFSDDVLKNKRNSEAIEVSPNTLVSARLLAYQPATVQPLVTVNAKILQLLMQQQARVLVQQKGDDLLAQLRAGKEPASVHWGEFKLISRSHAELIPPKLLEPVFAANEKTMPAYMGGMDVNGDYQLIRVTRVLPVVEPDANKLKAMQTQLAGIVAQQAFADYLASLTKSAKIEITKSALEKAAN
ncbi:MAG: peptidylprolyl isomerase [Sulfuriferula sp.]|nr:peptidylprolyl isomerase [Sulfuriferula sp.]